MLVAGDLQIQTPEWALPLLEDDADVRYKAAKGGRASGKSHLFAEMAVEDVVVDPDCFFVCIREVQKSLRFSAKRLIEHKIRTMGVGHLFDIQNDVIYRRGGNGLFIFQGMQDHTAESIKSLEGAKRAWIEEAQSLSHRSLNLLRPTIFRNEGAQIWATWNPDQPTDAIEQLLCVETPPEGTRLVHVNFDQNPFLPDGIISEQEYDRKHNPDSYDHVWLGGYNTKSHAQVFGGKWRVDEFEPGADWDGPYHGLDFGFANDPTAATKCWIHDNRLFIEREAFKIGLELDDTTAFMQTQIPGIEQHVIRADSARPESISYLKRHGLKKIIKCEKGKGSVEDGIEFIKSFKEIVIHDRCREMQREARLYSYKIDRRSGDILPIIVDQYNHGWDSIRYALEPMMKRRGGFFTTQR